MIESRGRSWCWGRLVDTTWAAGWTLLLLLGGGGCAFDSTGRSLGRGAASGGLEYLETPGTRERVRRVSDSLLFELASSFREQIRPTLDSTIEATLNRGTRALGTAQESLAAGIEGRISGSLQDLARSNMELIGSVGRSQLGLTVAQFSTDMERDLTPALRRSVTLATRDMMLELSENMRTQLGAAAEAAVSGAVRAGIRAGSEGAKKSPVWRTGVILACGFIAALVFLGVAWLVRERRRSLAALDIMAGEINRSGDTAIKSEIKSKASALGVEGWLHSYLARRGHV